MRLDGEAAFEGYRYSNMLPRGQLHPAVAARVWPTFLRGAYDTAVFEAFREVEIAVRAAAGLGAGDIGVELMRRAFGPGAPLEDTQAPPGERVALVNLLAGAMGFYRNPVGHRDVDLNDPGEAAEIIAFASNLLRIVDRRRARPAPPAPPAPPAGP